MSDLGAKARAWLLAEGFDAYAESSLDLSLTALLREVEREALERAAKECEAAMFHSVYTTPGPDDRDARMRGHGMMLARDRIRALMPTGEGE